MSQAPVGQRSAHRPQCRHTSSSLTMTRPVFRSRRHVEVLRQRCSPGHSAAGADRLRRRSSVKVMQSIGQMSTQASHSMQSAGMNTVWTSQLRQRSASR